MHLPNSANSAIFPPGLERPSTVITDSEDNLFKTTRMNGSYGNLESMAITVLILEDNVGNLTQLNSFFEREIPDIQALFASNVDEAHTFMSEYPDIQLFLIGGHVAGGTGVDFLGDVKTVIPDAKAILMEDNPFHEHNDRTRELGIVDYVEIPINFQLLKAKIKNHLNTTPKGEGFKVTLSRVTLIDIIQIKCSEPTSQSIEIQCDNQFGKIFFNMGKIVYAEATIPSIGYKFGEDALKVISGWSAGNVVENHQATCPPYHRINYSSYDFLSLASKYS